MKNFQILKLKWEVLRRKISVQIHKAQQLAQTTQYLKNKASLTDEEQKRRVDVESDKITCENALKHFDQLIKETEDKILNLSDDFDPETAKQVYLECVLIEGAGGKCAEAIRAKFDITV